MRSFAILLIAGICILAGNFLSFAGIPPAVGIGPAAGSPQSRAIERAIVEYYGLVAEGTPLTEGDRTELENALADEMKVLSPEAFNDLLGHLIVDYRNNPHHRMTIEGILSRTSEKIAPELWTARTRSPMITVVDDVFAAWSVAYVFGFGKGVWESRGQGLKGLAGFRNIVTNIAASMPKSRRANLGVTGAGGGLAIAHLIYQTLEERKLDPRKSLSRVRQEVLGAYASELLGCQFRLGEIKRLGPGDARNIGVENELQRIAERAQSIREELETLAAASPEDRGRIAAFAVDFTTIETAIAQVRATLQ